MKKKYENCLIIGSNKISKELISCRIELEDSYDVIVLKKEFKFENKYNIHFHSGLESLENLLNKTFEELLIQLTQNISLQ